MSWTKDLQSALPSERALWKFLDDCKCCVIPAFSNRTGLAEDRPGMRYDGRDIVCPDSFATTRRSKLPRLFSMTNGGPGFFEMKEKAETATFRIFGNLVTTGFDVSKWEGYKESQEITGIPTIVVFSHGNKDVIVAATVDELRRIEHSDNGKVVFFDYNKIPVLCTCEEFGYRTPADFRDK